MSSLRARTGRFVRRINWPYWFLWLATLILITCFFYWRAVAFHLPRFGSDVGLKWSFTASGLDCVLLLWFLASGAAIGSFVNLIAYRMPLGVSIHGVSRCVYCNTSLSASENWPIFGWFRVRGRCKTCRLPIRARYVLVELWMMVVFGVVYCTEFMTGGANLPSQAYLHLSVHQLIESSLVPIVLLYLWCESGLVAVSLFACARNAIPNLLTFWIILPCFLIPLFQPSVIQVGWQTGLASALGNLQLNSRVDAVLTTAIGGLFGFVLAIAMNPLLSLVSQFFVRTENVKNVPVQTQIQGRAGWGGVSEFKVGLAITGALMGWQATVLIAPLSLLGAGAIGLFSRLFKHQNALSYSQPACAVWFAVLVARSTWHLWW